MFGHASLFKKKKMRKRKINRNKLEEKIEVNDENELR